MKERIVMVRNRAGIHARPAAIIAQTANKFACSISLEKPAMNVNAKSIMGVITMAAGYNAQITVRAEGTDEEAAVEAFAALFDNKFDEE